MTDTFLEMMSFPPEYNDQVLFFEQLKVLLQNKTDEFQSNAMRTAQVSQTTEPNQAQWEAAWLAAATGNTLPIPPSAQLIWWNPATNFVGGIYGTTPLSTTVVKREARYPRTGTNTYVVAQLTAQVTSTAQIGALNSNHPSVTFTLPVLSDLQITYSLYVKLSVGTGTWGADCLLDGVKIGTVLNGVASNAGVINSDSSGQIVMDVRVPNVEPGVHTVQAIFGVTGSPVSPPTLIYGGVSGPTPYGVRVLRVRGFTK
jgi:hypothetical protein